MAVSLLATPLALLASPAQAADPVDVQILATNDFHGRIQDNRLEAGAAVMAGAVQQLRTANPTTVFAAAGDLIGASTFESFVDDDNPTIDALNAAGLEVSAVGNHEFDKGYGDLTGRVIPRASWKYLAANIGEPSGNDLIDESWIKDFGTVQVGFVGAVTEELPSLVSPAGIEGVTVEDITQATNAEAASLRTQGADAVVLLVHEGYSSSACDDGATSPFGSVVAGASDDIDAIVSGHTHQEYVCDNTDIPVVSAGQYGMNLNRIVLTVEDGVGVTGVQANEILPLVTETEDAEGEPVYTANYPVDETVQGIVDDAVANAETLGARPLGTIDEAFDRAQKGDGSENRGGESTLGNLVAEVQRWATSTEEAGAAEIAFMNPGGLRADMSDSGSDGFPEEVTYKEAAVVQPFANTLVNMTMTGGQIRRLLEQQWQPAEASRPFLKLGVSDGFEYTYDPTAAAGDRIRTMWLDGKRIGRKDTFSVTANSFLASGGDNFGAFTKATGQRDTGKIDLQAMVDYMDTFASDAPLQADFAQRAVGVHIRKGNRVALGRTLKLNLTSLAMTGADDVRDDSVVVKLGSRTLERMRVDNTVAEDEAFDESGRASERIRIPNDVEPGRKWLRVIGQQTGTRTRIPIRVVRYGTTTDGIVRPDDLTARETRGRVVVRVRSDHGTPRGKVRLAVTGERTRVQRLDDGRAVFRFGTFRRPGLYAARATYLGVPSHRRSRDSFTFRVTRR